MRNSSSNKVGRRKFLTGVALGAVAAATESANAQSPQGSQDARALSVGPSSSLTENKEIVRAFYEAGNRGNLDAAMALLADDVRWTNIGSMKYSGIFVGKENLTSKLLGPVFGQMKAGITAIIDNVIAEGDFVVVQLRGMAETKTGTPYNNTYCHIFTVRDGKVRAITEYLDTELAAAVLM